MEDALKTLCADLSVTAALETALSGKNTDAKPRGRVARQKMLAVQELKPLHELAAPVVEACRAARKRKRDDEEPDPHNDEALSQFTRFTDWHALAPYKCFLHYVPRLVNVVRELRNVGTLFSLSP